MDVRIEPSWKEALKDEFDKPYFLSLVQQLHREKAEGRRIFPPGNEIFKAFELTPVDRSKSSSSVRILITDTARPWGFLSRCRPTSRLRRR